MSHAYDYELEVQQSCKVLDAFAKLGQHAYQAKNYAKALDYFQDQASWTHFCLLNEDFLSQPITRQQLATAYNNVGLTQSKLNRPRWAKVWYSLIPEDNKSQFNLSKLVAIPVSSNKIGTYVRYSGQGAWDTLVVSSKGNLYQVDYSGLNMKMNGMLVGPNMGEFSVQFAKNRNTAQYHYEKCVIHLNFKQGERIEVTQNQADCGFGSGVDAEGIYIKVEDIPN